MDITIEVCCQSASDVFTAVKCGADRVELNSALFFGGLTPSVGSVEFIREYTNIPIMVMVRPREGGFSYTRDELEIMVKDIRALLNAGADGIVFGCLRQNGTIDESACMRLLDEIGNHTSVFHRAFDMIGDNFEPAIDTLVRLGVSRVLTSGGAYTATAGIPRLTQIKAYAGNDIDILPCGKIRADNAARIMRETGINSVHTSATTEELDVTGEYNEAVSFVGKELPRSGAYTGCNGDILSHFVKTVRGSMRL